VTESFERLRSALEGHGLKVQPKSSTHLISQCPAHQDNAPSLSVDWRNDRTLIKCFAGCQPDEIISALGLEFADLFDGELPEKGNGMVIRSYVYETWDGKPWIVKDRMYPKSFIQRLPGTEPGERTGIKGRAPVLYHLPQLLKGIQEGRTPHLVEGEKDVETAERHGLLATCAPSISGKWDPGYSATLGRAEEVVIIIDQDGPGRDFAARARDELRAVGVRIRCLRARTGKDLTDHFEAGHTYEEFVVDTSISVRPRGMDGNTLLNIDFPPIRWAIEDILPAGLALLTAPPKAGKALALDTAILTTEGWSTMGELKAGMSVYAMDGRPTRIIEAHPVQHDRPCYRVTTRSGASVVADESHLWLVSQRDHEQIVETKDLAKGRHGRRWCIPTAAPVHRPRADLPIDPWVLGYWLGNGTRTNGEITINEHDAEEVLTRIGEYGAVRPQRGAVHVTMLGVLPKLRALGVLDNKHIPESYLMASIDQRRALLAGLLDSDGYPHTKPNGAGEIEFCTTDRALADGTRDLCLGLGIKASIKEGRATLNGKDCGPKWRFVISAGKSSGLVTLSRRIERLPDREPAQRSSRDGIELVERVDSVPVRCITVEHESGCFLAGRDLMVTHNSWISLDFALSVAAGGFTLGGIKCNRGSVIYLAREDGYRRVQSRMDVLLGGNDNVDLSKFEVVPSDVMWDGGAMGIAALTDWAEEVGDPTLVILDTLAKVEPDAEDGDRYRNEYAMMARYKSFADRFNCAVLAVHHDRKSTDDGGDIFTRVSGTRGLTGAVDTMMFLDRKRGESTGILHLTGRDVADQEIGLRKSGPLWVLGDGEFPERAHLRAVK
jgi:hypothetical protein